MGWRAISCRDLLVLDWETGCGECWLAGSAGLTGRLAGFVLSRPVARLSFLERTHTHVDETGQTRTYTHEQNERQD